MGIIPIHMRPSDLLRSEVCAVKSKSVNLHFAAFVEFLKCRSGYMLFVECVTLCPFVQNLDPHTLFILIFVEIKGKSCVLMSIFLN